MRVVCLTDGGANIGLDRSQALGLTLLHFSVHNLKRFDTETPPNSSHESSSQLNLEPF